MFRDGLLSPRSKLLPGGGSSTLSMYLDDGDDLSASGASVNRANSVLSVASTGPCASFSRLLTSTTRVLIPDVACSGKHDDQIGHSSGS